MRDIFIGWNADGQRIRLTPDDRAMHMHLIGSTRTGKSKLLEWIIRQDIKNGEGLCLIDPHGTLYEDVVRWCAYHNLIKQRDIILLNPSKGEHIVGFNPFVRSSGDISVQMDSMIVSTIRAWDAENTDQTPSLERGLRCLYMAMIEKEQTIVAAEYLLNFFEQEVREYLTSDLSNPMVRQEWRELASLKTPKQFQEELLSTKNRLFRLLCSEQIYRFMGNREGNIDVREIMDRGKVLLVNLAESDQLSKENARLFGSLLINEFCRQARRRRRDERGQDPRRFYLYIDEFQDFVSIDIADGLDELRKFGLSFILSHQRLGQLGGKEADVVDAIFSNVGIRAAFGTRHRDTAKYLAENMFVNQLDLKEVKNAIYQTKFWPRLEREESYSRTSSHSAAHSSGRSAGQSDMASSSTGSAASTGKARHLEPDDGSLHDAFFGPDELSTTESTAEVDSHSNTSGRGRSSSSSEMDTENYGESESVMDMPVTVYDSFEELSSVEHWTLEEQLWRMSEALMSQLVRHCFIQLPGRKTGPMLVPKVKEYGVLKSTLQKYEQALYNKMGALKKEEADRLIAEQKKQLESEAQESMLEEHRSEEPEDYRGKAEIILPEKAASKKKPKRIE